MNPDQTDPDPAWVEPLSHLFAAAAGAAVTLTPAGPIAGALVAAAADPQAQNAISRLARRMTARPAAVMGKAARLAGISIQELDERLAQVPGGEDLLYRTLRAAMQTGTEAKLVAYSRSLAAAVRDPTELSITFESQLVNALQDLDAGHFHVLRCFTLTHQRLGLGDGESAPESLDSLQLRTALPALEGVLPSLTAGLERHGLLDRVVKSLSALGGPTDAAVSWVITAFGKNVLARMDLVGPVMAGPE